MAADIADILLDQLINDPPPVQSQGVVKRLNYSHKAMIDQILAQPGISQRQLAATFGYSESWICQVMSSDAFQSALAERSAEIIDPTLTMKVEERFNGLVSRSLDILQEKLSKSADLVPDNLAVRVLEVASRAAGYGAKPETPPASPVTVEFHLEQLGGNLTKLLQRKKTEAVDVEILAITADPGDAK